jgi:UDPglucose 6-dehydrogenase
MSYKLSVIGTGYVGLVSGTLFAETGNEVICVDIDENKVQQLQKGIPTIFEIGLDVLLKRNVEENRLKFTTKLEEAVKNTSIIFLCLPTPPSEDGSADLHHVLETAEQIALIIKNNNITEKKIIVNKSTVPVGTGELVHKRLSAHISEDLFEVISNPEFLREGFALEDAMKPERIIIGCESKWTEEVMRDLYQPFVRSGNPIYFMDIKSAEITKYAANSFLAVKISFMNDLSRYCELVGADIEKVRIGIGSDSRIGKRFLFPGIGYGGSCFPKDVKALLHSTSEAGVPLKVVQAAQDVNKMQIERFSEKIIKHFNNNVKGKTFALWGLAFKPNTDDTRDAPAFEVIKILLAKGAKVKAFDPQAVENTKMVFGDKIEYSKSMYACLESAEALIIATEWSAFRNPDLNKLKSLLLNPIIFDGRNIFEPEEMRKLGFEYSCIGRN